MIPTADAASMAAAAAASTTTASGQSSDTSTERRKLDANVKLLIDEFLVVRGKETSGSPMFNWRVRTYLPIASA